MNTANAMETYTCGKCLRTSYNPDDVRSFYCGHCHLFAEQLRDEPVTRFFHLTKKRVTKRECFTLALLALIERRDDPTARLVHGVVPDTFNPGRYVQHAWAEMTGTGIFEDGSKRALVCVMDYTQPDERATIIPRDFFLERVRPLATRRFTLAEAYQRVSEHGVDGPWPDSPRHPLLSDRRDESDAHG